ncbi:ROK family protein, partial [Streptomyces sp. NPDC048430]|uniref:ROK family protein n=1 Tax=Streptomyces sp. NPDC048430 TaxID=3155388 RepID=UPI0034150779
MGYADRHWHRHQRQALPGEFGRRRGAGVHRPLTRPGRRARPPRRRRQGTIRAVRGGRGHYRLAVEAGAPVGADHDIAPLFAAAEAGDRAAVEVADRVAARFARGLAALLLVLDPGRVVIGGGVSRAGDTLLEPVRKHLRAHALVPVAVSASMLGQRAVALGAVRHALDLAEERVTAMRVCRWPMGGRPREPHRRPGRGSSGGDAARARGVDPGPSGWIPHGGCGFPDRD